MKQQSKDQVQDISNKNDILKAWDNYFGLSQMTWNLFFAFLVVLGQVGQNVTLPLWFAALPEGESMDPLFVLIFAGLSFIIVFGGLTLFDLKTGKTTIQQLKLFSNWSFVKRYMLVGLGGALNGLFLVFAADPSRTPAFLQAVLSTFNILWTILFRAIILKKLPNKGQTIFATGVFYGLFLSSIPSIFNLTDSDAFSSQAKGSWKILWPLIFASSFAPAAIMNVVGEDILKETTENQIKSGHFPSVEEDNAFQDLRNTLILTSDNDNDNISNVNVWYYLFMESLWQEVVFVGLFWMDIIPTFGTAKNVHMVFSNLKQDWRWFFGLDGAPATCTIRALVFVALYIINYIGSALMLRYTEGATWTAVVGALVTPIGGIFWLLFELNTDNNHFGWNPTWESSSWYIIIGLIYMTPFIFLYNREIQIENEKNKNDSDPLSFVQQYRKSDVSLNSHSQQQQHKDKQLVLNM